MGFTPIVFAISVMWRLINCSKCSSTTLYCSDDSAPRLISWSRSDSRTFRAPTPAGSNPWTTEIMWSTSEISYSRKTEAISASSLKRAGSSLISSAFAYADGRTCSSHSFNPTKHSSGVHANIPSSSMFPMISSPSLISLSAIGSSVSWPRRWSCKP